MDPGNIKGAEARQPGRLEAAPSPGAGRAALLLVLIGIGLSLTTSIMAVLLEPIRTEFGLSDGSLGMLANLGFGAGLLAASLPGGIAADHLNRRNILSACLVIAGLATAFGGLGGIAGIVIMRIVAGSFHGPNSPAITSLFSDLFPAHKRASIMGLYFGAQALGTLLDFLGGGYLAIQLGWRATLMIFGLASVVIGLALPFLLKEPARERAASPAAEKPPTTRFAFAFLWSQRSAVYVICFSVFAVATLSSTLTWLVSFFVRIHQVPLAQSGSLVALAIACGVVGTFVGGILTDRMARRDARWGIGVSAVLLVVATIANVAMVFAPSIYLAVGLMMLWALGIHAHLGPAWGILQGLVPPRMRGRASSVLAGLSTLVGFGLGPAVTGLLSQAMTPLFGGETIRYAMAVTNLINLVAIAFCLLAIRQLPAALARIEALGSEM